MLHKCGLYHFRCFVQLIKVTVSFESLFFVRSILYFCFCFFPCFSLFYFQLSGVIEVSSVRTFFIFSVPFSYLSYFSRIFQLRFLFLISALAFFFLFQPPFKRFKFSYTVPAWESSGSFHPLSVKQNTISWVRHDGKPLQPGIQSPQPRNSHLASNWVESVSRGDVSADVSIRAFPDPAVFVAGRLHCHLQEWKSLAASSSSPLAIPGCLGLAAG